ncbi:hypothetical protein [uncultured Clostridium sp.]|uniref:hypothetical protein n=1 Tax=uncultured Clostridium sp. TaxID=59620 RepID=UPI00258DDD87|nr:hypothetical protein [uncultured Clostridium sp.]
MKKSKVLKISILSLICISIIIFYIWRFSPFLPHIDRNEDESFTYNNVTYIMYQGADFLEKFKNTKRGKKVAIINKKGELPRCTVYEVQGDNSENILIVYEEIIMSIDTYYIAK